MNFTGAFAALGYDLRAPRTDWSAERADGVCLSLWSREIDWKAKVFDTRLHAMPIDQWNRKPGFKLRLRHMTRAVDELGGRIDVILVTGKPGESYEDAHPWKPEERHASWYVTDFDRETGHFRAELKAQP